MIIKEEKNIQYHRAEFINDLLDISNEYSREALELYLQEAYEEWMNFDSWIDATIHKANEANRMHPNGIFPKVVDWCEKQITNKPQPKKKQTEWAITDVMNADAWDELRTKLVVCGYVAEEHGNWNGLKANKSELIKFLKSLYYTGKISEQMEYKVLKSIAKNTFKTDVSISLIKRKENRYDDRIIRELYE